MASYRDYTPHVSNDGPSYDVVDWGRLKYEYLKGGGDLKVLSLDRLSKDYAKTKKSKNMRPKDGECCSLHPHTLLIWDQFNDKAVCGKCSTVRAEKP